VRGGNGGCEAVVIVDLDPYIEKAGGRFRMVALVQKRMRELQKGLAPLVEWQGPPMEIALEELRQEKIWLVTGEEARRLHEKRAAEAAAMAPPKPPAAVLSKPAK
jgi:DNA-directed RNA polymerase subunit K/omega